MAESVGAGKGPKEWIRWSGVAWMTLFLFWLPVEDVSVWPALALSGLGLAWFYMRWRLGAAGANWRWPWMAGLLGLAAPVSTLFLLVFKSGVHSHGFPELPVSLLSRLLRQIPVWGLIGVLFGFFIERGFGNITRRGD
jgi:hypothetical protein